MGIAQSSQLMVEWFSDDDTPHTTHVSFIGPKVANNGAWTQFLADLKRGGVNSIFHIHLTVDGAISSMLYTPNPQRIDSLLKSIEASRPSTPVDLSKLLFSSNITLSEDGLAQVEAAKKRARSILGGGKNDGDSGAPISGGEVETMETEFAAKVAVSEKTGLKQVYEIKAGEQYKENSIYPLRVDGFVVVFEPHTGIFDWVENKSKNDILFDALEAHSARDGKYKMVAILNIDDTDFAKDPYITDKMLDKFESFIDTNKIQRPAVVNVFTPGFDVGQRLVGSERPRDTCIATTWSPSAFAIS